MERCFENGAADTQQRGRVQGDEAETRGVNKAAARWLTSGVA